MKDKKKRKQFTFAETAQTNGLIEQIDKLASDAKRKRNDYVSIVLMQHVEEQTKK